MEKVTVSKSTVEKLKTLPGGIQSVVEKLKKDGIQVKFDGSETSSLEIEAEQDIAQIIVENLAAMSDKKGQTSNKSVTKGKFFWSLKGQHSTVFHYLFLEEKNSMEKLASITVETEDGNEVTRISFPLSHYKDMKTAINKIEAALSESVNREITVVKKFVQKAKAFVKIKYATFIAFFDNDKLRILSRSENGCKEGQRAWEAYSKGESIKQYELNENSKHSSSPEAHSHKDLNDNEKEGIAEKATKLDNADKTKEKSIETEGQHLTLPSAPPADASFGQSKIPRTQGFTKGKGDDAKYCFIMGKLTVYVYKKSITELVGIDVIVNAANEHLAHGGGVAFYIAKAAGKKINDECQRFIANNKKVNVTENFVSGAGDLKYKAIIHAVGPQWYDYDDRRDHCTRDLHNTVVNALEVAERKGWARIALPAISSALFGVPKILCAQMYIKALETFASRDDLQHLKEIHFVDLNDEILQMVKEAHQVWVDDPSKLDFQNANQYVAAPPVASKSILKKTASSTSKGGPASNPAVIKIIKETATKMKKKKMICSLPRDVLLFVYEGSVLDMEAQYDAITCPCEGVLSDLIANEVGTAYYEKQLEAFRDRDEGALFSIKGKGDKLSNTRIVHIVHRRSHFDDSEQSLKSLSWRTETMLNFLNNKYRCPTLPCLLPGKIQDLRKPAKNFVQEILDFCVTNDDVNIKEIHVVDTNPTLVQAITSEIRSICTSM
ncbi:hypothetical protein DPMN_166858 [Dreissena polymorpha]|uniref:Macro domain-containing protein n=1 Tax=Dreissena polymorpha TaxID=45954 RepID=A0A9D4EXR6_DREPO|nr:hypothetical protein DPMN_166858 [Dreissena polymorpha]